jgi:L,D-transpeptidase ErfK/SrfK
VKPSRRRLIGRWRADEQAIAMAGLAFTTGRCVRYIAWAMLVAAGLGCPGGLAFAAEIPRNGDLIGDVQTYPTRDEDTLIAVARLYDLGFVELRAANPTVDPWLPGAGVRLTLPSAHLLPDGPREGIVVNIGDLRLYRFKRGASTVATFPIGTPRVKKVIPIGVTAIAKKRRNPVWIPPASIRAERPGLPVMVPPGPDNPLGALALNLGWRGYVIHGTNKPAGVGRRVSSGCIRLYPEDIKRLFRDVATGERVRVVDQPVKAGWSGGPLYLEAHPTKAQADEIEADGKFTPVEIPDIRAYIRAKAGSRAANVDWRRVERVLAERRGVPVPITR